MAGIVHFSNFYRWMEQAEHDFFRSLGLTIVHPRTDGTTIGWPRVSANCRFEAPVRYEDIVEIHLTIQRIGLKSLTYDAVFSVNDKPVARGTMKTCCCLVEHDQPLRSVPIPREYLDKLEEHSPEQRLRPTP